MDSRLSITIETVRWVVAVFALKKNMYHVLTPKNARGVNGLAGRAVVQGAACMNNTFCLGVFMFLIYFRKLAWEFSAETLTILFVQVGRYSGKSRASFAALFCFRGMRLIHPFLHTCICASTKAKSSVFVARIRDVFSQERIFSGTNLLVGTSDYPPPFVLQRVWNILCVELTDAHACYDTSLL